MKDKCMSLVVLSYQPVNSLARNTLEIQTRGIGKSQKIMGKSCFMVAIECLCLGLTNGTKDSQRNQNDYSMKATLSRGNLGISQGDSSTTAFRACYDSVSMIGAETRFGQDLTPPLGILPCRKG